MIDQHDDHARHAGWWGAVEGWHVLSGLSLPGSGAVIDHVVVTPAGAFIVDLPLAAAEPETVLLWTSRRARRGHLDRLHAEVAAVVAAVADAPGGPVPVHAVIAALTPERPLPRAPGVDVVPLAGIVGLLAGKPRRLDPDRVDRLAELLDRRLGARTATTTAGSSVAAALPS